MHYALEEAKDKSILALDRHKEDLLYSEVYLQVALQTLHWLFAIA